MYAKSRWLLPTLLVMAIAFVPSISEAKGFGRGRGGGSSSRSSSSSSKGSSSGGFGRSGGSSSTSSSGSSSGRTTYSFRGNAPVRSGGSYYVSRPSVVVGVAPPVYYGYYTGWGVYPWGYYSYGYYPIWGAPTVPPDDDTVVPTEEARTPRTRAFSFYLGGAAQRQGFAPSGSLHFEGKRWGFNFQGVALVSVPLTEQDSALYMPLLSGHLTYSVISSPHLRVRAELGGSSVMAAARTYIGPDIGASGQLALVGPLALQAAVHYTPVPARITDIEAGLGLNFGGLGLKAGWRTLRLDDSNLDGGVDYFNGPTVAIGAIY